MPVFIPMSQKGKAKECSKMKVKSLSCVQLFVTPWTITYQTPLSMGFSKQEYWSGFPFLSPGDLPDPGIKPRSPALQADALPSEPPGKPKNVQITVQLHSFHILARLCSKSFKGVISYTLRACLKNESEVAQSCPTLWDPMNCNLSDSSVHGIFQAIVLEWIAVSFSRGCSQPRD